MKTCNRCKESKILTEFSHSRYNKEGKQGQCKTCINEKVVLAGKTKVGLVRRIYQNQRSHSKSRGDILPEYNQLELRAWVFAQPLFHELYDKWVEGGYNIKCVPSCDRLDDYKHYTLSNLRVVDWATNYI